MIRNLFPYSGSKRTSLKHLLPLLPYNHTYVEPFCGTGIVLMNRARSPAEVLNDLSPGIIRIFRVIRDQTKCEQLLEWIDRTVHSKEEFHYCKDTWQTVADPVESAARWLYMAMYSFSGDHKHWGRQREYGRGTMGTRLPNRVPLIREIHKRIQGVTVSNLDWASCVARYDSPETVFYLDPPYLGTRNEKYTNPMDSHAEHKALLDRVHELQGFVAISGYPNHLYDSYHWDARHTWLAESTIGTRSLYQGKGEEVLWIKNKQTV